jgi:hypothetical protein
MVHNAKLKRRPHSIKELGSVEQETKMSDEKLIAEVARVWVNGGGDVEGLDWCHQKLKEAVDAEIQNRLIQEQM